MREGGREGGKEGGKEGRKEGGREGGKEGGKEERQGGIMVKSKRWTAIEEKVAMDDIRVVNLP